MRDRLSTVLRLRSIQERQAAGRAAQAQEELRAAQQRVAMRRAAYRNRPTPGAVVAEGGVTLSALQLRALQVQGSAVLELLAAAESECDQAEGNLESAQQAWSMARANFKSTERLSERRQAEQAAAARTAASRALDELVVLRRSQT